MHPHRVPAPSEVDYEESAERSFDRCCSRILLAPLRCNQFGCQDRAIEPARRQVEESGLN